MRYTITSTCLTQPILPLTSTFSATLWGSGSQVATSTSPVEIGLLVNGQPNRHLVPDVPGSLTLDISGTLTVNSTATNATTLSLGGRINALVAAVGSTATNAITLVQQWTETATAANSYFLPYGASPLGTATNAAHAILLNHIPIASAAQTASNAYSLFVDHVPATTAGAPNYLRFRVFAQDNSTNATNYQVALNVNGIQIARGGAVI